MIDLIFLPVAASAVRRHAFTFLRLAFAAFASVLFLYSSALRADEVAHPLVKLVTGQAPAFPGTWPTGAQSGFFQGTTLVIGGWDGQGSQPLKKAWVLPGGASAWQSQDMRSSLAWAATATWGKSLVCAGGMDASGATAKVSRFSLIDGHLQEEELPSLPTPRAGAAAAVLGDVLYVFGGTPSPGSTVLLDSLITLNLKNPAQGWQTLPPLPSAGRVLPVMVSQYGILLVIGGREVETTPDGKTSFRASSDVWAYLPKPLEGSMKKGWQKRAPLLQPVAGGSAVPVGPDQVFVVGGDAGASEGALNLVTASQPASLWIYHVVTNAWADTGVRLPNSAAMLASVSDDSFVFPGDAVSGKTIDIKLSRSVRSLEFLDYLVIALYFCLLMGIGWYFSRRQDSSAEFSLGGRKVAWWAAGISMFATGASAISFMAIPALAFATNLIWVIPLLTYIPAYFVQAYLIFPLLRKMDITSTYEYLERRFNVALRLIASAQCIILQTFGRASVVLVLPALAIASTTGINIYLSVVIMGVITTIYTSLGGFEAVIWTEVFQGILKFIAPLAMIFVAIASLPGGFHEFWTIGMTEHKFQLILPTWRADLPAAWLMCLSIFLQATIYQAGDQPTIQRVFSSPMHEVRRVAAMSAFCSIVIGVIVNVMGVAIFCYFRDHPLKFDPLSGNDQVVPLYTIQALPVGVAGVVIAAIFASAMATVASSMNSVATIFTEDFYLRWYPKATEKNRLRVLKTTSYVVGFFATAIALVLASLKLTSMMAAWTQIVSLLGGGIVGVYSLGMFTRKANGTGAIIGAVSCIIIMILVKLFTPLHWMLYLTVAVFSCTIIGYVASLIWGKNDRDLTGLTIFTPRSDAEVK